MNRLRLMSVRSAVLVLGAALLMVAGSVLAQDDPGEYPPNMIEVWPYPGEEVGPDTPVEVTFDQAMDPASVEAAWQIEPPATGMFTWRDGRTLAFLPDGGWTRATRYTVAIGTGAASANGLVLEAPVEFIVQTAGYLEVAAVIPAPDAEGVQADATITVSFDRPVVPLVSTQQLDTLPDPLVFDPPIEGAGEWINTSIYQFTPAKPLSGGTSFVASIPAGLTDVTGSVLEETYSWRFKTLAPEILSITPYQGQTGVLLESAVNVQFSQPMDRPSTEEAFMLLYGGERVPGAFTWSEDGRGLTFQPADLLRIETPYTISLAPTARSAEGDATLEEGVTYLFTTVPYPGIERTSPENGEREVYPGGGVTFTFKSPMNTETFADKAVIVEPQGVAWEPVVYDKWSFTLSFATQPETTYIIQFNRGAEDLYGNAIETDYTLTFSTGALEPWATLPSRDNFMITNAYREDTRIAMGVQARPTVGFTLYRIAPDRAGMVIRSYYGDDVSKVLRRSERLREWTQQLDPSPALSGVDEVLLASEQGGQLVPGIYYLEARVPNWDTPQTLALGVVTANLTVKRAPGEILIWATDIQSAEPVASLNVTIYRYDGNVLVTGQTDADGLFRAALDSSRLNDEFLYAIAEGEAGYGVWHSWGGSSLPDVTGTVYTERPIYRPGETVYFRGALRDREDMTYFLPRAETVHVTVDVNWGEQVLFDADVPLTEFGTFDGQFDLAEDAPIGTANIAVRYRTGYDAQVQFSIAEFRVPEYKVEVTPDYPVIVQGDPVKAVIAASYYFGGPVSGADLSWTAIGESSYFNYSGPGRYTFSDETQDYFGYVEVGMDSAITDANGQVIVTLENTQAPSIRPMMISLEGQVVDESGQYIAGRTSILAHPAEVYVGLRTDRYFGRENTPLAVDLIAVTPESEPLPGQAVELQVVEVRWERIPIEGEFGRYDWRRTEIEVETSRIVTGDDGTAQFVFTPPQAGIYRVRALSRDERERVNAATLRVWVTGEQSVWWGRPSDTIDLIADRDSYQSGDTAEILVPVPFTGISYVMMTVERAGIQQVDVLRVDGSTLVYELPITEAHVPTVHVTATLMKGTDADNLNPAYKTGAIALNVTPVHQRVAITVTPSTTLAQPGDTVTLDVKAVDSRGEPVRAEVGVAVTDLAILSLMPPNSQPLEQAFYGYQSNYVYTGVALEALLDTMTDELIKAQERMAAEAPMAAPMPTMTAALGMADSMAADEAEGLGGGPGDVEVTVREDFQQTPLWAPRVVTDATGQASVSVTLPDNLTTWHVDARGLTTDTRVGDAALDVVSTLPLLVRPVTPRFFVVGDRVTLATVINNNTGAPQTVQATLRAEGVTLEGEAAQTVIIEAAARARVEWIANVQDVPSVDLTFIAIGEDGYQDAAKPMLATGPDGTIPVYRYTAPDTVGTGGILREGGSRTEAISLPPRLDVDQGDLTIKIDPSLAATTIDALDYLKNYPHQCIEQTISRFLPNIMTYRALADLGLDDPELKASLTIVLDEALAKLAFEQNPDGGWGWFSRMESNPYITAYAALGLIEARDAGFAIDQNMIDRALNFVRSRVTRPTIDTPAWELNRLAFYLYVFARGGQVQASDLALLLDYRLEMDTWALSFLLMAYHQFDPADPAIPSLVSDLQSGAILSATGAHWEEDTMDWWNWSSDTRTTAMALSALTRVQPDHDLLPNIVRWLMVARQGDHWVTTQETAWAVMALTDWMKASGELRGDYDYAVALNGGALTEGTVTPETVRQGAVLRVQVADLLRDEANRLTFVRGEGEGVLYYTAYLNTRLWASEAKPISRGLTVTREYFQPDDPKTPVTSAEMGDVITVRVTINLPQEVYYFVLEDPIPAGTEPIDTSLLTTSQLDQAPTIRPDYDPYWYWGWWLFDHTEMRDEQVNLYADFLPRGTYVYTYQVRATVPGEFQTMPSHGYAFYFPEVFGRGAGTLFTVTAAD